MLELSSLPMQPAKRAITWARIGMLTPSSNTVLEPYSAAMFAQYGEAASVHFARFRVTEISLSETAQTQFDADPILEAARLLADARVDVIAWNGTAAGWLGFERDDTLGRSIEMETGVRATSTILALNEILRRTGVRTMGLVSPYLSEVQDRIIANYAALGIDVIADRRLEDRGNFSFAEYSTAQVAQMVREVAEARPDVIIILCTNFRGAPIAAAMESELNVTILDSVTVTTWGATRLAGLDPARITGWGRILQTLGGPA